jgi:hypothetical protein
LSLLEQSDVTLSVRSSRASKETRETFSLRRLSMHSDKAKVAWKALATVLAFFGQIKVFKGNHHVAGL